MDEEWTSTHRSLKKRSSGSVTMPIGVSLFSGFPSGRFSFAKPTETGKF